MKEQCECNGHYRQFFRCNTLYYNYVMQKKSQLHITFHLKCDTSSNDTSSNEPFRLKVTLSKWLFVDCTHCRKMVSSNSFDKNILYFMANKLIAMLLCWSCAHHMTTDYVRDDRIWIEYFIAPFQWEVLWIKLKKKKTHFIQNKMIFIHRKSYQYQFITISCLIWIISLSISVSFETYNPGYRMYFQYRYNRHS